MVTTKGVVKLVDFGSAKQEVAGDMMSVRTASTHTHNTHTHLYTYTHTTNSNIRRVT